MGSGGELETTRAFWHHSGEAGHTWSTFAGGGSRGVGGDRCGRWGFGFVCVLGVSNEVLTRNYIFLFFFLFYFFVIFLSDHSG